MNIARTSPLLFAGVDGRRVDAGCGYSAAETFDTLKQVWRL